MQVVLVSKVSSEITEDYVLDIGRDDIPAAPPKVTEIKYEDWGSGTLAEGDVPGTKVQSTDSHYKRLTIPGTTDFATYAAGLQAYADISGDIEDQLRRYLERIDQNEGIMVSSRLTGGFGSLSSKVLEQLREEFGRSVIFGEMRIDYGSDLSEHKRYQALLGVALSTRAHHEYATLSLPVCSKASADYEAYHRLNPYLCGSSHDFVLNAHLQSINTELRYPGVLASLPAQLNHRNDTPFVHLAGAIPVLPASFYSASPFSSSVFDFSVLPSALRVSQSKEEDLPLEARDSYAEFNLIRGYSGKELEDLGAVLRGSVPLKEPLVRWTALPESYPLLTSKSAVIFKELDFRGRPLSGSAPVKSPPSSVPIYSSLRSTPKSRHLFEYLYSTIKGLNRTRALGAFESLEGDITKDTFLECQELLETLADSYGHGLDVTSAEADGDFDPDEIYS